MGTFGCWARILASTQRARARRDHVGKNWRESARACAKLWTFMDGILRWLSLWEESSRVIHRCICPRRAESAIGLFLHQVLRSDTQVAEELAMGLVPFGAVLDPQQERGVV